MSLKVLRFLLFAILLMFNSLGMAASSQNQNLEKVVLYYEVEDVVLMCQNSKDDMQQGTIEFEKELRNHYGKRFEIQELKRYPKERLQLDELRKITKPDSNILIVTINLLGQGVRVDTYQNIFGAQRQGSSQTAKIRYAEAIAKTTDSTFANYFYGVKEYSAGTIALGGSVHAIQNDPRKIAKNGIRGYLRDVCTFDQSINKYSNNIWYQREVDRYYGNFNGLLKKDTTKSALERKEQFVKAARYSPKFEKWIEQMETGDNKDNIERWLKSIDTFIISGWYTEVPYVYVN